MKYRGKNVTWIMVKAKLTLETMTLLLGGSDSTCGNVFSLTLNDSRHAALPIGFTRVHGQQACTWMRVYGEKDAHTHTPTPSPLYNHTHTQGLDTFRSRASSDPRCFFTAASLVGDLLWHLASERQETVVPARIKPAALLPRCAHSKVKWM